MLLSLDVMLPLLKLLTSYWGSWHVYCVILVLYCNTAPHIRVPFQRKNGTGNRCNRFPKRYWLVRHHVHSTVLKLCRRKELLIADSRCQTSFANENNFTWWRKTVIEGLQQMEYTAPAESIGATLDSIRMPPSTLEKLPQAGKGALRPEMG